jgi:hypothetical protein
MAAATGSLSTLRLESNDPAELAADSAAAAAAALQADVPAEAAVAVQTDSQPAAAAAAIAESGAAAADGPSSVFAVAAGSFQCVWFFSLGERHHKPVFEWVQQQLAQQQQQQQQQQQDGEGCGDAAAGPAYCLAASTRDVPQVGSIRSGLDQCNKYFVGVLTGCCA